MTLERLRVNTITLKWKLPLLRYSRLARASTHKPPQSPSLPRPFSHLNYPAPTYIHPVPAAGSACLALVGDLGAANIPQVPTRQSQALELALPGHQGHMLGHQYQSYFSSLTPQT